MTAPTEADLKRARELMGVAADGPDRLMMCHLSPGGLAQALADAREDGIREAAAVCDKTDTVYFLCGNDAEADGTGTLYAAKRAILALLDDKKETNKP